jgi:diguanylate cyclase (GGDEF)-like protein
VDASTERLPEAVRPPVVRVRRTVRARVRGGALSAHRVTLLITALVLGAIGMQTGLLLGQPALFTEPIVPLWLLVPLFALTDGFVIHLRVRRGGHAIGLSEIPLVLGLLSIHPALLLAGRVGGASVGLVAFRRQRGQKLAFNLALFSVEVTTASLVHRYLVGDEPLGPSGWIAVYVAMCVTDLLAVLLLTAVISLQDDPGEWRRLPGASLQGLPMTVTTTSIALVTAMVVQADVRAVAILGVVTFVAHRAYRSYVRQNQGQAQVEGLYEFTRVLGRSIEADQIVRIVLDQARDQLRAATAELIVPGEPGRPWTRMRMSGPGQVRSSLLETIPEPVWWRPALDGQPVLVPAHPRETGSGGTEQPRDAMAVPVPVGDAGSGVLLVVDSLPDIPTFGDHHIRLFQALANHASVSLANAQLVNTLRREVAEKDYLALYDPLTGLPNRTHFHRLLAAELRAAGTGRDTAVLLMDLDRFKEVNEALGHDTGDALLREVGERLGRRLGSRGVVARLGGDEFAVLAPGCGAVAEVVALGDDLTRELENAVVVGNLTLTIRASIGAAVAPAHGGDAETLLRRADVAMYAAKEDQSGVRVYQPEDDQNSARRLALVADLREAISSRALNVVYQPKVGIPSGLVVGAEALARWRHPEHGFIPPVEFVPLAEHTGLIRPLTLFVLEVALDQCASWRAAGHDLHVAVNLSPRSLADPGLPDVVARLLLKSQVPASALTLEITEGSIVTDPTRGLATLADLHALGVRLAIDDFGTGYSSLGRLRDMPLHEVKIDKSFVQGMAADEGDQAVVRSAVQLGRALGLDVVAEGVEDMETYAHLTRAGCDVVQGYFLSHPLSPPEFDAWLADHTASRVGPGHGFGA